MRAEPCPHCTVVFGEVVIQPGAPEPLRVLLGLYNQ